VLHSENGAGDTGIGRENDVVDVVDGRNQAAFNAGAGVYTVAVIDLDAERNTGGDDDGLGGERNRSKGCDEKERRGKWGVKSRHFHSFYRPAHREKVTNKPKAGKVNMKIRQRGNSWQIDLRLADGKRLRRDLKTL
jgi:hypothetical protein